MATMFFLVQTHACRGHTKKKKKIGAEISSSGPISQLIYITCRFDRRYVRKTVCILHIAIVRVRGCC